MAKDIRELKEAFKSLKTVRSMEGLEYEDVCVHPDVDLPAGYKVPKFDMFDGKGNPRAHLMLYCDKLVGVGNDEAIRMKLFIRSLTGEALDWYTSQDPQKWRNRSVMEQDFMDRFRFNTKTNPDRFYLMTLEKKTTEYFREYAKRWRAEVARVQPPMGEDEMTTTFIRSQTDTTYYERLISMLGKKFSEVVRMGDIIEEGLKSGKITNLAALQATSKAIQSGTIGGANKIEELIKAGTIQHKGAPPNVNNNPLPNHDDTSINMISTDEDWNLEGTIVPIEDENKAMSSAFIAHVITVQVRAPIEVESDVRNKGKAKLVVEAAATGMTRSGRCYVPKEASRGTSSKDNNQKKSVTEAGVEEFWRKMQCSGYSIVDQLKKTPAQISLMSLLMSFDSHRNALVKVLNEAYVLVETTSEHLETMVAQILEAHKIYFHEDELPPEGLSHNKALHLTVKCRDKFISRVLIDNGSALNICPFTTLKALGIDIGKVRESHVNVRAFDGAQMSAIAEIDLALQIGPMEFIIEFQVSNISATYNLLLGRPWIHMAGAVPSTLHQNVKFVWNHQEVVIHGEASNPIYSGNSIHVIESVERLDGATFQIEEIMTATRGKEIKLPSVFVMVASEMLKNGFEPGRGLGARLHGILEPIQLPRQNNTFGLGYEPTPKEVSEARLKKKSDIVLPQPIPPLSRSFPKTVTIYELDEDAEDDLVEGIRNLFIADCNVILKDCTESPTIWDAALGDILNNWTCTPSPQDLEEYEEDLPPAELTKELEQFENKSKPNLDETELINLGNLESIKETRISVHLTPSEKEKYVDLLR
ncbi:uncharacterized protein [Nicotiana sylvestris]|uniref:uncharacterized protein n=1 Tax=Nicotiana sylvestris TaxID=4096 RepID=UPI00388CC63D